MTALPSASPRRRHCLSALVLASLLGPALALADASPLAETGAERAAVASPQDRSFLTLFLRAGVAAAEAGQLATQRARLPEVRRLGAVLGDAFQAATRQLDGLTAPLGLSHLPREPDAEHKVAAERLQQAAPLAFDRQFLDQQLQDQEDLLQVLDIEASTGDNPDLKAFAARELDRIRGTYRQTRTLAAQLPAAPAAGLSVATPLHPD